jgi:hypothetical protein
MKRIIAGVLTVALMGLLLWSGSKRPPELSPPATNTDASRNTGTATTTGISAPSPAELRLTKLLDCATRGDVAGYLESFGGVLRERLQREMNERGREAFAADLKRAARSRKSHAMFAVEPEGPAAARITVETVYPDRNERQTYHLTQETDSAGWLVTDVETVRSQVPQAKYGTMASFQEPEGVPVQGLAVGGIPLRIETGLKDSANPKNNAVGTGGDDDPTGSVPDPNP